MSGQPMKPSPTIVARASMAWDVIDMDGPRRRPRPAESVSARIVCELDRRATATPVLRMVLPPVAAIIVAVLIVVAVDNATMVVSLGAAGAGVLAGALVRCRWSWFVGGSTVQRWRRQVRHERRVARSLAPLESAGWTVLHDRAVAAHRVPHVLVGPPGVVLVYDYLAGSLWRYRARRLSAIAHSVLRVLLSIPLVALHRRGLPHLSAATAVKKVTPGADAISTAAWARSELADRLALRPDLDGWTVAVSSFYVLLNRPTDRVPRWATASAPRTPGTGCARTWKRRCPPGCRATPSTSWPTSSMTSAPRPNARAILRPLPATGQGSACGRRGQVRAVVMCATW